MKENISMEKEMEKEKNIIGNNIKTNRNNNNKTKLVKINNKVKFSIPINIKNNKSILANKPIKN